MSLEQSLPPRTSRGQAPQSTPPRKPRTGRIIFSFVVLVILVLAVFAGYLFLKTQKNIDKVSDPNAPALPSDQLAEAKPIGILVLGLDTRSETGSMNTDVMMTALFNPKSKTATIVSIPRDSDLNIDGYKTRKANAYFARFYSQARSQKNLSGEEAKLYAGEQMRDMLSKFFGVPIDYTVRLDFKGFVDVVNALGGVDVNVDQDMRYWDKADGTDINLVKGDQHLNGEAALGFVRYRKSKNGETPDSSDFARNDRQDRVLGAIIGKLKSIGSVPKIGGVLDAVGDNMKTDFQKVQIQNMIATYLGINRHDVRFIALSGKWKSPYVYLDPSKLDEAKLALQEELLSGGRPSAPPASGSQTSSQSNG